MFELTNMETNAEAEIDADGFYQLECAKAITETLGADWELVKHKLTAYSEDDAEDEEKDGATLYRADTISVDVSYLSNPAFQTGRPVFCSGFRSCAGR